MPKIFFSVAQKIAPIFILLTAAAWFLVIVGFGIGSQKVERVKKGEETHNLFFNLPKGLNDRADPQSYPLWMVAFSGVAVVVAGLLHAAFEKPFSMIFGALTAFLSVLFISALGMILYVNGTAIRLANDNNITIPSWYALEFAGAFLALLFWVPVMILWFFYDVEVTLRKH